MLKYKPILCYTYIPTNIYTHIYPQQAALKQG